MAVISPYRMQSWRQARSQAGADSNELLLVPHMASAECAKHRAGFGYRVEGARYRGLSAFRVRRAAPITPGLLSIGVNAGSSSHSPQNQSIPRAVRHEKNLSSDLTLFSLKLLQPESSLSVEGAAPAGGEGYVVPPASLGHCSHPTAGSRRAPAGCSRFH